MGEYTEYEGALDATGMRIAVVAGRFNDHVTKPLLDGALDDAARRSASTTCRCTGCPARSRSRWSRSGWRVGACDAVICLGAVIRGDTPHFDYVAGECAAGIAAGRARHRHAGACSACSPSTTSSRRMARARRAQRRATRARRPRAPRSRWSSLLRQLPAPPRPTPAGGALMLRLVLPKGSLERADAAAVRGRRPRGVARLRRRLPRHASTTRASTRCASCARRRSRGTSPRAASTSASPGATGSRSATPTS